MSHDTDGRERREISLPASFGSGLLMGGADAIPGVSGGTIALIIGIYERFIGSIAVILRAPRLGRTAQGRTELAGALRFLVPLGLGVGVAYVLVTKLLVGGEADTDALMKAPSTAPICYGFFFGLVLFSLKEPWRRLRHPGPASFGWAALGCAASSVFSGLPYAQGNVETWMLLYGGAGAISVMLLPGVSGSLLLVMLGQYTAVVEALHDRDIPRFAVFLAGVVIGVAVFVPLLRRLLRTAHDATMATLTGLMAGSLRALWPWKANFDPKAGALINEAPGGPILGVVIAAMAGAGAVYLLSLLEKRLRTSTDTVS